MRIKEEIKRVGDFWLPSSPEHQVPGTLSISDGGHIKLELTQPLDPSIKTQFSPMHPDSLKRILGHVEKDGPVMIDQCYRVSNKPNYAYGRWMAPCVIKANRILTNCSYNGDANLRFNTLTFSIEGLDEWVGITGIDVDGRQIEEDLLTISYSRPADISLDLKNGMQLIITFAWTPPGFPNAQRAEVTQKTYFKLVSQEARELEEFTSVAQKITAFLCFVMNEIVCLDSMSATSNSYPQEIADGGTDPMRVKIYCASWPYAKDEPAIDDFGILFKYKDRQDCGEKLINNWIKNYEQVPPAFDLYFLAKARTLPSLDLLFLTLVQALEAFHHGTSGGNLWLSNRLKEMMEPFDCLVGDERRPKLIEHIVKTRNYLTHHNPKLESEAAKGTMLEVLCHKMNALFRLQFLKLIGFDEQEINDIVDKCPYLKGQCSM